MARRRKKKDERPEFDFNSFRDGAFLTLGAFLVLKSNFHPFTRMGWLAIMVVCAFDALSRMRSSTSSAKA